MSARRRVLGVLVAVVLVMATAGCARTPEPSQAERAVEGVVRAYNDRLAEGLRTLDMNALSGVATKEQATVEYTQMAALGESGVRLDATLRGIEFDGVTFSGDSSATVTTTETWDYRHLSTETSETVKTETGVVYHLRYTLDLVNGRWLVSAVTDAGTSGSKETTP